MFLLVLITLTLRISLAAIIKSSDNLRDVRELFASDIVGGVGAKANSLGKDSIKDPIRGIQSFVTKVVNPSPVTKNIDQLETLIEDGFVKEYPNFAVNVDIVTKDLDATENGIGLSFNISQKINATRRYQDRPLTPRKQDDKTEMRWFEPSYENGKWKPIQHQPVLVITEKPSFRYKTFPPYFPSPTRDFRRAHENFHQLFSRKFLSPRKRFHPKMFYLPHLKTLRSSWKLTQETSLL